MALIWCFTWRKRYWKFFEFFVRPHVVVCKYLEIFHPGAFWKAHSRKLVPNWTWKIVFLPILIIKWTIKNSWIHNTPPQHLRWIHSWKKKLESRNFNLTVSSLNFGEGQTRRQNIRACARLGRHTPLSSRVLDSLVYACILPRFRLSLKFRDYSHCKLQHILWQFFYQLSFSNFWGHLPAQNLDYFCFSN